MARDFPNAITDYLSYASALASPPFTVSLWVNVDTSRTQAVFAMGDEAGGSAHKHLVQIDSLERPRIVSTDGGGSDTLTCSAALSLGSWAHIVAVFASTTDRRIFLNGGNKTTSSVSKNPAGLDNTTIGALKNAAVTVPFDGKVAEVGLWNIALSDADAATLGKGLSPACVQPQALVAYWPLLGNTSPEKDVVHGFDMTMVGTVAKSVHPRIFLPHGQQ